MASYQLLNIDDIYYDEVGNYLLNNTQIHDVIFLVGTAKKRIGAVKLALINQSRVWWAMLAPESGLCEKKNIFVPDIEPEIFIIMLKHCYGGLFDCTFLSDDCAMKLCYCANKYDMRSLMKKLEYRLQPTNMNEFFPALQCLVHYNLKGVERAVLDILHVNTKQVLDHPKFLQLHVDCITHICKQQFLFCTELDVWNAVVNWARHQVNDSEDGPVLREVMLKPLKHIRLLTVDKQDLIDFVFPLEILTTKEIACICKGDVSGVDTLSKINFPLYLTPEAIAFFPQSLHRCSRMY